MNKTKTLVLSYIAIGVIAFFSYLYLSTFAHNEDIEMLAGLLSIVPALYLIYGIKLFVFNLRKPAFKQAVNKYLFNKTKNKQLKSIVPVSLGVVATAITLLEVYGDGSLGDLTVVVNAMFAIGGYVLFSLIAHVITRPKNINTKNVGAVTSKPFPFLRLSKFLFPLAAYLTLLVLFVTLNDANSLIIEKNEHATADAAYDEVYARLSLLQIGSPTSELDAIVDIDHKYRGNIGYNGLYRHFSLKTEIFDLENDYFERLNHKDIRNNINSINSIRTRLATTKFLEQLSVCVDNPRLITIYFSSPTRSENPIMFLVSSEKILGISTFSISGEQDPTSRTLTTSLHNDFTYDDNLLSVNETGSVVLCDQSLSSYLSKTFVSETNELNIFPTDSCKYGKRNYLVYYRDSICPLRLLEPPHKDELISNIIKEGFVSNE